MKRSVAIAAVLGLCLSGACATHNKELERKVDELARAQQVTHELERRIIELVADLSELRVQLAGQVVTQETERLTLAGKLTELAAAISKLQDQLAMRPAAPRARARAEPDPAKTYAIAIAAHDPVVGPGDAKVTLVEAYDYACPYCERVRETIAELRGKYGKDLRVVYKQYVVHPQVATANALAACAANKQNRFAELDAVLWDQGFKARNFDKDDASGTHCWDAPAGCPIALGYARELGLDVARFQTDMLACKQLVDDEIRELTALGVSATPSFFINGRFMSGAMPAADFAAVIDQELGKATDRIKHGTPAKKYYQQWVIDQGLKTVDKP